jgi:adenylate cyclase
MRFNRRSLAFWAVTLVVSAAAGVAYTRLFGIGGPLTSAVYGVFTGTAAIAMDSMLRRAPALAWLRAQSTIVYLPIAEAAMLAAVIAGNSAGGFACWALGLSDWTLEEAVLPTARAALYSFLVSAVFVFATRVRDLIGGDIFLNLLLGRYHRPIEEERVFLFVDVVGSTAYAEAHGDLAAQTYLGEVFAALAEPVRRHRGAVEDYVGDLAIISWPLQRGLQDGRCVACLFAIVDTLARDPLRWQRQFGKVPEVRAALHGGPVVAAEIGVDRHKIAYFGDVLNTTARLEALSRTLEAPVLVSGDLLARFDGLPDGIAARDLGSHRVRGRNQTLQVHALERAGHPSAARAVA